MSCRILFMGTPDFAVPCLQQLLDDGYDVAGVFSQPDRPRGRGFKLQPPPVKQLALARGLPVHQPEKMRDGQVLSIFQELKPDLAVVVAYGRVLPPEVLATPRLGCINVHASLLPRLRGAAPIQWSIINGDTTTGVSVMHMAEGLDTGDVILAEETLIGPEETAGQLFDRLSALGAQCLSRAIPLLLEGRATSTPQDDTAATWAPPIQKEMSYLDFDRPAGDICNLVRGLSPTPVAKTWLGDKLLKIHKAVPVQAAGKPGTVLHLQPLTVACREGAVELVTVQPEGKKPMSGADFARGRRLQGGEVFTAGKREL